MIPIGVGTRRQQPSPMGKQVDFPENACIFRQRRMRSPHAPLRASAGIEALNAAAGDLIRPFGAPSIAKTLVAAASTPPKWRPGGRRYMGGSALPLLKFDDIAPKRKASHGGDKSKTWQNHREGLWMRQLRGVSGFRGRSESAPTESAAGGVSVQLAAHSRRRTAGARRAPLRGARRAVFLFNSPHIHAGETRALGERPYYHVTSKS